MIYGNSRRIFYSCSQHIETSRHVESVVGIQLDKSIDDVQLSASWAERLQPDRAVRHLDASSHMHTAHTTPPTTHRQLCISIAFASRDESAEGASGLNS